MRGKLSSSLLHSTLIAFIAVTTFSTSRIVTASDRMPTGDHYKAAMGKMKDTFSHPELQKAVAVRDDLGFVAPEGATSIVFQLQDHGGAHKLFPSKQQKAKVNNLPLWARTTPPATSNGDSSETPLLGLKCWTVADISGHRKARYQLNQAHIADKDLPQLVRFSYLENEMLVSGKKRDVLLMEWADGLSLDDVVADFVDEEDVDALHKLAERVYLDAAAFSAAGITLGDVQLGNMMVVGDPYELKEGSIRYFDKENAITDATLHLPVSELGHPHFRHPLLDVRQVGHFIDAVPRLVTYLSILGVAADFTLWDNFNQGEDHLIFQEADLQSPASSPVFAQLFQSPDPNVVNLANALFLYVQTPPAATPSLEETVVSMSTPIEKLKAQFAR